MPTLQLMRWRVMELSVEAGSEIEEVTTRANRLTMKIGQKNPRSLTGASGSQQELSWTKEVHHQPHRKSTGSDKIPCHRRDQTTGPPRTSVGMPRA